MTDLIFYDAAYPPARPPAADGVAFYIGGDTPHVWTKAEVDAQPARYRLPIFVRSTPVLSDSAIDVTAAMAQLQKLGAPKDCLVAWDTESSANPAYMADVYRMLTTAGYQLIDYGSQNDLFANEVPDGYYWGADWNGKSALIAGDAGTQYANDGEYDMDVFKPGLPFWDTRPAATSTDWQATMMGQLPELQSGATGADVKTVQALCTARGYAIAIDGIFGPATQAAVRDVQGDAKVAADGVVGPQTWPALMGIA